ncbi:MAG: hypothetical protein ACJ8GN_28375 [Longimicrobiaceae bacterium]
MSALGVLASAFAGGLIGGIVAAALPQRLPRLLPRLPLRSRAQGDEPSAPRVPNAEEGSIGTVYRKITDVMGALERVQDDLNTLSERVSRLTVAPAASAERSVGAGTHPGWPSGRGPSALPPPPETRTAHGFGTSSDYPRYDPPSASDVGFNSSRGDELVLEADPYASLDAGVGAPAGPPANALNVEARDDRIVSSSTYPPEAWLEIGPGPAEGRVTLNPAVALNEYALRRLSTFFEWQGTRVGSTYHTMRPATVRWDDGQRVGTVVSRGVARPR